MIPGNIGDGIAYFMITCLVMLIVFVPLGIWKIVEIIIWLIENVSVSFVN
jgi:hypothetical protein